MTTPHFARLNVVWELPDSWCESDHIAGALTVVEHLLAPHGLAEHFIFVVTSHGDKISVRHPERVIAIQTSDEGHEVPAYLGDVFLAFKNYRPFAPLPENLRIIPLGCNKDVPDLAGAPISERGTDVFFIGRDVHRDDFFAAALPLNGRDDIAARIDLAPAFREGLSPADYAAYLADTKIALSPRGVSHETFRTYEALRAGCAVIAARQLPSWFVDGWPVIEVDDWTGLDRRIEDLLSDTDRLQNLSARGQAWWRERCCPEAVGRYIVQEIVARLTAG